MSVVVRTLNHVPIAAVLLTVLAVAALALVLLWSLALARLTLSSPDPPLHAFAIMRGVALVLGAVASVLTASAAFYCVRALW